jgi:hypothetical protein
MKIHTNQYFRIGISSTKTLFKITNLKNNNVIKINVNDIIKAYQIKDPLHFNKETVLNRTLYFLDKDLKNLNDKVLKNKKQFNSICKLQDIAIEIRNEYFKEYYKVSLFKNLLNL